MGVSLSKGQNVVLNQDGTPLADVTVGLGWDARPTAGADFDLDASAVVCGTDQRVLSDAHFVFYNNLPARTAPSGTPATTSPARATATTSRSSSTWTGSARRPARSSSPSPSTTPSGAARASARSRTRTSASWTT